jgi:chorismate mutase
VSPSSKPTLADLRVEIDRIDLQMHELLMERGRVIDQLIEIKTRQGGGSAFRPAREATSGSFAARHRRGHLAGDYFHVHLCPGAVQRSS